MASAVTAPRVELHAVPGLPRLHEGDDLVRLTLAGIDGAGMGLRNGDVIVFAQKVVSKVEDRLGPRHGVAARDRPRRAGAQGRAAGRADPVRIGARRARLPRRADRRAPAGLRDGQRRGGPVQRCRCRRRRVRAPAAARSRRQRRAPARRVRVHRRRGCRGADQRQLWPPLARGGRGHRLRRPGSAPPPARPARPVRAHAARHRSGAGRRNRLGGLDADGSGRRGPAGRGRAAGLPAGGEPGPARALVRPASEDLFR